MAATANWLERFLKSAISQKLCTKIMCTTCGASDFRRGLMREAMRQSGRTDELVLDGPLALEITRAMAMLPPAELDDFASENAARLMIYEIWTALSSDDTAWRDAQSMLEGTWAGAVKDRMEAHEVALKAARRARLEYESPDAVRARREEKMRKREAVQRDRRVRKQERDRRWHAEHGGTPQ